MNNRPETLRRTQPAAIGSRLNMVHRILTLFFCAFFLGCQNEQQAEMSSFEDSVFKHFEVIQNAQLDVSLIPEIASASDGEIMDQLISRLFKPIRGDATVYIFRSKYLGRHKEWSEEEIFHDILAVEVDSEGMVSEAFVFPENYAEMPLFASLFRMTRDDLSFDDIQRIGDFSFQCPFSEWEDVISGVTREVQRIK